MRGFFGLEMNGLVINIEKLVDMIALTVYIQSCDTEMLRWIGEKGKQHGLRSSQRQRFSRLIQIIIIAIGNSRNNHA